MDKLIIIWSLLWNILVLNVFILICFIVGDLIIILFFFVMFFFVFLLGENNWLEGLWWGKCLGIFILFWFFIKLISNNVKLLFDNIFVLVGILCKFLLIVFLNVKFLLELSFLDYCLFLFLLMFFFGNILIDIIGELIGKGLILLRFFFVLRFLIIIGENCWVILICFLMLLIKFFIWFFVGCCCCLVFECMVLFIYEFFICKEVSLLNLLSFCFINDCFNLVYILWIFVLNLFRMLILKLFVIFVFSFMMFFLKLLRVSEIFLLIKFFIFFDVLLRIWFYLFLKFEEIILMLVVLCICKLFGNILFFW